MTDLAKDIGLEDDLITNQTGQSYIFAKNQLYPIPGGSIMGIPTDIKPFLNTFNFPFRKIKSRIRFSYSAY